MANVNDLKGVQVHPVPGWRLWMWMPARSAGRCPTHLGTKGQKPGGKMELGNTGKGDAAETWGS